jgi:aspartate racemase
MLAAARPAVRGAALGLPRRACCRASSSSSGPAAVTKTKCIGILGGMSPSSTELYYSKLNTSVREALGGLHSADCIIRSVDFEEIAQLQTADRWDDAGELLGQAAAGLEAGGAEVLILATNTMHKVAPAIKRSITIPFIDIFSATAAAVVDAGCSRPLLMATAYTMEQDFCLDRLREAGL